ncbi:TlpA family protein disulfide reductase [Euzebya pacifica]|uniref:TlpA family protein disulfide reductase n=1 Tax=Euzebya pacifica TaxID=1608957 RepID=UPI0030F85536
MTAGARRSIDPAASAEAAEQERDEMPELIFDEGRPRRARWPLLMVVVLIVMGIVTVLGAGFGRDPSVVDTVLMDQPAPPLSGPTLGGGTADIADHTGQVVVVNVWASWCVPCRREHPLLVRAAEVLAPHGVQFIGINTQDTERDALRFLDEMGELPYPSVLDPDGRWAVEWGTFGVPETFVIDRTGRIRAKRIGELTEGWIVEAVGPLVEAG